MPIDRADPGGVPPAPGTTQTGGGMILFLDTNVLIYALESHVVWGIPAQTRIATAQAAGDSFMISDLVRMECLVLPLRQGNVAVGMQYRAFFDRRDVAVVGGSAAVCDRA